MVSKKVNDINKPGIVDGVLILVLVIWIITLFVILNKTLPLDTFATAGLSSITAFSALFSSIMLIIIAIILEGIRREIKGI